MGMANIINGKALAKNVIDTVTKMTVRMVNETAVKPGIAVVIVGDDPASQIYVRSKDKKAQACGFLSQTYQLPAKVSETELLQQIGALNTDEAIHGILVQLPLPGQISEERVIAAIAPEKDVDGFHPVNVGLLQAGLCNRALIPCTPAGCLALLKHTLGPDLGGLNAMVLGRSNIVGKPVGALLLQENCTPTIAHSRTRNIKDYCRQADIVVAAIGKPEMVTVDWIKPGATVIDVGINRIDSPELDEGKTRLVGDVEFSSVAKVAAAITPVPGGVGPMTIAMLMANTLIAAARSINRPDLEPGLAF